MKTRQRLTLATVVALAGVGISPVVAQAATASTYYVSPAATCTDLGPGTEAEPFCTIQQAASVATVAGDTVMIENGTYSDEVDVTAAGTASTPITFEAVTAPTSTSYAVTTGPLVIKGASYIDVRGIATSSVQVTGASSDVTLSRLKVAGSGSGSAIDIDAGGTGNVVTTSLVYAGRSAGITVDGSSGAVLTSNTVYGYCGTGIAVGDDGNGRASGATIENNVIAEAETSADVGCSAASATGLSVQSTADLAGITSDYNSVYPDLSTASAVYDFAGTPYSTPAALDAATGQGAHDSVADPVLNTSGAIGGESSPLINAANAGAPDEQTTDVFGNARVADPNVAETGAGTAGYDRGAIQFVEVLGMGAPTTVAFEPSGATVNVTTPTPTSNWAGATFTYLYSFGDGTASSTPSHQYTTPGTYTITVTATSSHGAKVSNSTSIKILAPTGFSASLTVTPSYGTSVIATLTVTSDWPITGAVLRYGDGKTPQDLTLPGGGGTVSSTVQYTYAAPGTYAVSAVVTLANGGQSTVGQSVTTKGTDFTPYGPTRLLDTRKSQGGTSSQLLKDGSIKLKIAGTGSIPANVTAVALNLTAVNANGGGYIQADTGTDTGTSTVNYNTGPVYSNAVIAQVATDGTVTLRNFGATAAVKLDLIADVTGYFAPTTGSRYDYVTPTRLMDTRKGLGVAKAKLGAGKTDVLTIEGAGPVPAAGVTAVTVNITETNTTGSGYLLAYPDQATLPDSSTVDWSGSTTKAATAIVPVGADGRIDIHDGGAGTASADVIVDVTGYFTSTGTGDVYVPATPDRFFDTRKFEGTAPGTSSNADLSGQDGTPPGFVGWAQYNTIVDGYVLNATVTQTPSDGYLLVSGDPTPGGTSTVNWTGADQTTANLAFTRAGRVSASDDYDYYVYFYNGATTGRVQVIADVMGYFAQT
ncbi:MAG TPA: PKD domain-containing protein [Actinospica sp.]|nr:PKD domain-containing protein [Actinospica sp.]